MTFAVADPIALERMVKPLGAKRRFVGNQKEHHLLQPVHIKATGMSEAFPILEKPFGEIRRARQGRALALQLLALALIKLSN